MKGRHVTALSTTIYPAGVPFLREWAVSVRQQRDMDFDLWVASDGLNQGGFIRATRDEGPVNWVDVAPGEKPVALRNRVLGRLCEEYDYIVCVDCDDVLQPDRVEAAKRALQSADLNACAMRLVDTQTRDLSLVMKLPDDLTIDHLLPTRNLFGLSNTAWQSALLRRCLPAPEDAVLMDWFLSTRAWGQGGRLSFDPEVRMLYRIHDHNTAVVLGPFTPDRIRHAADLVVRHYDHLEPRLPEMRPAAGGLLRKAIDRYRTFYAAIRASGSVLEQYASALNRLKPEPVWWACLAHPQLEELWNR